MAKLKDNALVKILMDRDGLEMDEAIQVLREAAEMFNEGEDPEDILHTELGLEPDFVFDLIDAGEAIQDEAADGTDGLEDEEDEFIADTEPDN